MACGSHARVHDAAMKKRVFAALIWFYVGWYAGAFLAEIFGVSPYLGPLIGAAAAGLVAGDPRHLIWKGRPSPVPGQAEVVAEAA